MSSQFSYELDERQIRILMQDAESEYNEALWNKFDSIELTNNPGSSVNIGNFIPKFNLSISRSVVVPILFIILIGGLSAMLFSFVDFKKKESIDKETPLVANPNNFKKQEITKQSETEVKKPVEAKAILTPSIAISSSTLNNISTASISTTETKKEEPIKIAESKPKEEVIVNEPKKEVVQPVKKKKKRKVTAEELPTIKAVTTNLNEGVNEPELDLK